MNPNVFWSCFETFKESALNCGYDKVRLEDINVTCNFGDDITDCCFFVELSGEYEGILKPEGCNRWWHLDDIKDTLLHERLSKIHQDIIIILDKEGLSKISCDIAFCSHAAVHAIGSFNFYR